LSLFLKDIFLQHGLLDEHFTGKFMAMAYIWKPHSYIPWHNDGIYSTGVTIYLNRNWNLDWGGLLIWKEKGTEKLQVSPPHFNIAVVNCNGIEHATTMVSPDAPLRQTIQCFW
jgi:Rps23 Pro-64 3,4-dihydroxylase Tpa1-like proline 4-hydroxylase